LQTIFTNSVKRLQQKSIYLQTLQKWWKSINLLHIELQQNSPTICTKVRNN
jgi:16S rRNA G527 N7-methylase RsmG